LLNKELQFLIYNTPYENAKVDVMMKDEIIYTKANKNKERKRTV